MFENTSKCEDCLYYEYDDEYGFYVCDMDLDEDETAQFIGGRFQNCPYYRPGDEYTIVRKQILYHNDTIITLYDKSSPEFVLGELFYI